MGIYHPLWGRLLASGYGKTHPMSRPTGAKQQRNRRGKLRCIGILALPPSSDGPLLVLLTVERTVLRSALEGQWGCRELPHPAQLEANLGRVDFRHPSASDGDSTARRQKNQLGRQVGVHGETECGSPGAARRCTSLLTPGPLSIMMYMQ